MTRPRHFRENRSYDPLLQDEPPRRERIALDRSQERTRADAEQGDLDKAVLAGQAPQGTTRPRMSRADLEAAARGTNASPASPGFDNAFGPGADGNRSADWRATFKSGAGTGAGAGARRPQYDPLAKDSLPADVNSPRIQRLLDTQVTPTKIAPPSTTTPGAVQPTPFGPVSTRLATKDQAQAPRPLVGDQSAGPQHAAPLSWQQEVVAKHPEIGVAGSQANAAFVQAYKAAHQNQTAQGPNPDGSNASDHTGIDHMTLAKNVMDNIRGGPGTPGVVNDPRSGQPVDPAATAAAGAKALGETPGLSLGTGVKPLPGVTTPSFAGAPVTPAQWDPIASAPSGAQKAGQVLAGAATGAVNAVTNPIKRAAGAVGSAVKSGAQAVYDFGKGVFGGDGNASGAKPTPPAPTAGAPTPTVPGANGGMGGDSDAFPLTNPRRKKGEDDPFGAGQFAFQ